jgi:hypothetical protein
MTGILRRRDFLGTSAAAASVIGLGRLGLLAPLGPAAEPEARLKPEDVRLTPEIEPLVRLIEETPQEKSVAVMIGQLRKGVSYRQFLAALFLAALRMNVSPHHVYMIFSAHQVSLEVGREERLLPLFWALHTLQTRRGEGGRFPKPNLGVYPGPKTAGEGLDAAMRKFDAERAEVALLSLVRNEGGKAAMGRLWPYVARDSSNIGHRAIAFVSAWRTLETVGWQHAEPVCQFVVRELNAGKYLPPLYRPNRERAEKGTGKLPADWAGRRGDRGATLELLALLRAGDGKAACESAFAALEKGAAQAQAVWDAVFLAAGEIMLRFNTYEQLPARPLHTSTSMNALHYAFHACPDPAARLYTLLMAVDWTAGYIATELGRKKLRDVKITALPEAAVPDTAQKAVEALFSAQPVRKFDEGSKLFTSEYVGKKEDMDGLVGSAFAFARKYSDHRPFAAAALRLVCLKATQNAHDVKFPAAIFENYEAVSREWRPHLLAASMHWLPGTRMEDNPGVKQAREALRGG